MKKSIKYILLFLLAVVCILLIHSIRNYLIIRKLQDKLLDYSDINTYTITTVSKDLETNWTTTMTYYKRGSDEVLKVNSNHDGENSSYTVYKKDGQANVYTIDENGKKMYATEDDFVMEVSFYNLLESSNNFHTFLSAIPASVRSKNINGTECYEITNYVSDMGMTEVGKNVTYVDKETGLLVEHDSQTTIITKEYRYGEIDDSIFVEPDKSEYQLMVE